MLKILNEEPVEKLDASAEDHRFYDTFNDNFIQSELNDKQEKAMIE